MFKESKKTYHICLSSGNEVMFRSNEDYYRAFNCYALALYKTNSISLADAFMSNHFHIVVQTDNPSELMQCFRRAYSQYFNCKYQRGKRLGCRKFFCIEIKGLYHHLAAISYVLRNPVHHGLVATPFGYEHCSANALFKKDLGKDSPLNLLPYKSHYKYIGKHAKSPAHFQMSTKGVYIRESVTDLQKVEYMYMTPRSFIYYMNRRTSEEWAKEQEKDANGIEPVTLNLIEEGFIKSYNKLIANRCEIKAYNSYEIKGNNGYQMNGCNSYKVRGSDIYDKNGACKIDDHIFEPESSDIGQQIVNRMKNNEYGKVNYTKVSDIELCTHIDSQMVQQFGKSSVYHLTEKEKCQAADYLFRQYHPSKMQIARCLVL